MTGGCGGLPSCGTAAGGADGGEYALQIPGDEVGTTPADGLSPAGRISSSPPYSELPDPDLCGG